MSVYYGRASGTVWRYGHGSVLVLPSPGTDVVALSGTAEDLWQLLAEPLTVEELAGILAEAYEESAAEITTDIVPMLHDLVERRVLNRMASP